MSKKSASEILEGMGLLEYVTPFDTAIDIQTFRMPQITGEGGEWLIEEIYKRGMYDSENQTLEEIYNTLKVDTRYLTEEKLKKMINQVYCITRDAIK